MPFGLGPPPRRVLLAPNPPPLNHSPVPQYIVLLTLEPEGRDAMIRDPQSIVKAASAVEAPGVQCLGLYGVLGRFDFVCILDAPDNESAARFSLVLGTRAGASVETMPAVRVGLLGGSERTLTAERPEPRSGSRN